MVRAGKHLPALLNSAFGNTLLETPYTVMQLSNDATVKHRSLGQSYRFRLVLGRCLLRISATSFANRTGSFRVFPQFLKENFGTVRPLRHNCFYQHTFQFVAHESV